jgi:hypothetical protein
MIFIKSKTIYSEPSLQFLVICKLINYVDSLTKNHEEMQEISDADKRIRLQAIVGKSKYVYDYASPSQNEGQNYYMNTDGITVLRYFRTTVTD